VRNIICKDFLATQVGRDSHYVKTGGTLDEKTTARTAINRLGTKTTSNNALKIV
jgi:hypothetical protein